MRMPVKYAQSTGDRLQCKAEAFSNFVQDAAAGAGDALRTISALFIGWTSRGSNDGWRRVRTHSDAKHRARTGAHDIDLAIGRGGLSACVCTDLSDALAGASALITHRLSTVLLQSGARRV